MIVKNSSKILLVTNIPTPYRIPLFNELDRQLKNEGLKLKVIFGAISYSLKKWNINMAECKFDYEVLSSRKVKFNDPEKIFFTYRGLIRVMRKEDSLGIIIIGFSLGTMKIWWRSLFKETKYIIWSGAIKNDYWPDSFLRRIQRKMLIRRASGFIAYGKKAKEYLISLGADADEIVIGINTVDTKYYRVGINKTSIKSKNNNKHCLLYIGQFVKRKRVDLLFQVVKLLIKKRKDFILKLVGDGPEKENLMSLSLKLDINDYVSFEGYKQKKSVLVYLGEADCFLFPTEYDVWGLVLIEAMAAGLPCISSINAGATHDLINDGTTGFAMDFSESIKVAEKINWILENPEFSNKIGHAASHFITEHLSLEMSARGFVRAILKAFNTTSIFNYKLIDP